MILTIRSQIKKHGFLKHHYKSKNYTPFRLNVKIISFAQVHFSRLHRCWWYYVYHQWLYVYHRSASGMHLYKNMVDNGVLPGIGGLKSLWLCERERLIMIGYQTKLSRPLLGVLISLVLVLYLFISVSSVWTDRLMATTSGRAGRGFRLLYSLITISFIKENLSCLLYSSEMICIFINCMVPTNLHVHFFLINSNLCLCFCNKINTSPGVKTIKREIVLREIWGIFIYFWPA